jgi:hypothetical protein
MRQRDPRGEADIVARVLSVDAKKLLGRLRVLGAESPDGVVQDDTLWTAAGLKYEAYVSAAAELVKEGSAENPSGGTGFPSLKATPKGMKRTQRL